MSDNKTLHITDVKPLASKRGLQILEQKSFYKICQDGKALYVSKTKRGITRVDVSGFDLFHPAVKPLKKKNGKVTGQLNMGHDQVLEAITLGLDIVANTEFKGTKVS